MPVYYTSSGEEILLGNIINEGGEGIVYRVEGNSSLVAKIYKESIDSEKAEKLLWMITQKDKKLLTLAGWPTDILRKKSNSLTVGFLMPMVGGCEQIHELYGNKSRRSKFPEADWRFLIHAAINVARAFYVIHNQGHVIADVNHGNFLVTQDGTVKLIDCDSYHINANGKQYLCDVGVDTHIPPELQGKSLRGVTRTANHDAFGLAVLIFQLLFMARHPFSGAYLGSGESSIPESIKEHRFAYGESAKARQMRQPDGTLPLEAVSKPIAQLFERAFLTDSDRPTPQEWIEALSILSDNLTKCNNDYGHFYYNKLQSCPWCKLETQTGVQFFPARLPDSIDGFDIKTIGDLIDAIKPPSPSSALQPIDVNSVRPNRQATSAVRKRNFTLLGSACLCVGAICLMVIMELGGTAMFWLTVLTVGFCYGLSNLGRGDAEKNTQHELTAVTKEWQRVEKSWKTTASETCFKDFRSEIRKKIETHRGLPQRRLEKLKELELQRYQSQLEQFLDSYRIEDADIPQIGWSRKATLESYGIETAADIKQSDVLAIPGFGPTYTIRLIGWRKKIEKQFVFNPKQGVNPAEIQNIEREIATTRIKLEKELINAPEQLGLLLERIEKQRKDLLHIVEKASMRKAQAEASEKILTKSLPTFWLLAVVAGLTMAVGFQVRTIRKPAQTISSTTSIPTIITPPNRVVTPTPLPQATLEQQAQEYFEQGVNLTKARKYDEAAKLYEQAVTLNPNFDSAYHEWGYALLKLKKYNESVSASQKALTLRNEAETLLNLGLAYIGLEKWQESIESFEKAIKLKPKLVQAHFNLAIALRNINRTDEAIESLQTVIELKSDYAQAHYELGLCYLNNGDEQSALAEYETLASMNPPLAEKLLKKIYMNSKLNHHSINIGVSVG